MLVILNGIQADGYLARRFKWNSVLGTILDPAADKILMTTLTVTLAMKGMLPGSWYLFLFIIFSDVHLVPLAVIILGRDVLLSLSAFYIRYTSLPEPVREYTVWSCSISNMYQKTFSRYWDFSIPSAEVRPTEISKVINHLLTDRLLVLNTPRSTPLCKSCSWE